MRILSLLFSLFLLLVSTSANTCINRYCSQSHKTCKNDSATPSCPTLVNACLDLCPTNTDYACVSFCLSKQKSSIPVKFIGCCREYHCKMQRFSAVNDINFVGELTRNDM